MELMTKSVTASDTISTLVGQAVITKQCGEIIQIGEVYKTGHIFELSLYLIPPDGSIDLRFDCEVQPSQRELTAVIFGRHDTYQYAIGSVELSGSKGKARIAAVPCPGQYRCQMLF